MHNSGDVVRPRRRPRPRATPGADDRVLGRHRVMPRDANRPWSAATNRAVSHSMENRRPSMASIRSARSPCCLRRPRSAARSAPALCGAAPHVPASGAAAPARLRRAAGARKAAPGEGSWLYLALAPPAWPAADSGAAIAGSAASSQLVRQAPAVARSRSGRHDGERARTSESVLDHARGPRRCSFVERRYPRRP